MAKTRDLSPNRGPSRPLKSTPGSLPGISRTPAFAVEHIDSCDDKPDRELLKEKLETVREEILLRLIPV